jgi:hypothetical protein
VETDRQSRTVRLPFAFGEIVYHRARTEKIPGMITGFQVRERGILNLVMWSDSLCEAGHSFFELTSEFESKID